MSIFDRFEMENENVENVDAFHTNEQKNTKKKGKRGFSTNPYCARKRHSRQNGQKNHQMSRMSRTPFPSLPSDCPFETGGFCPPGCRYTTKFLVMMIKRGMLPDPKIGCPLRHVCGLWSLWPKPDPLAGALKCLGVTCMFCALGDKDSLWCEYADRAVIELSACPKSRWTRKL